MSHYRIAIAAIGTLCVASEAFTPLRRKTVRHSASLSASSNESTNEEFDFSDPLRPVVKGETLLIPFSENNVDLGEGVVNNGAYSWIAPYMSLGGYKEGATLKGGIATSAVSEPPLSDEEIQIRRDQAAEDLTNISMDERDRRRKLSNVFYLATAVYAGISAVVLDDGSLAGHLWRLAIFLPLSTAYGLQLSADRGL